MAATPENDPISAFIQTLAVEKGYSPSTCRAYGHDLREFAAMAGGGGAPAEKGRVAPAGLDPNGRAAPAGFDPKAIQPLGIRAYLGRLHRKNKKSTIARKLSAVRSFFRYLAKQGVLAENPADAVLTPKQDKPLPTYLTVDDVFRLLDSIDTATLAGLRSRAMFETLYSAGIRISELAGLDRADLDRAGGTIRVRGKGNRERVVPLGQKAVAAIDAYCQGLAAEKKTAPDAGGPLFLNLRGGRLTARSMRRILDRLARQCGLRIPISPHVLRHTFAISLSMLTWVYFWVVDRL